MKIEKLDINALFEAKKDEVSIKGTTVGSWVNDELVVKTYPLSAFLKRIGIIGYDFSTSKVMQNKFNKVAAEILKKDRKFTNSMLSVLGDEELEKTEQADIIDSNIDEFLDTHIKEFEVFKPYRRAYEIA